MEVWYTELQDERELLEAIPVDELYIVPTKTISDNSALHAPLCSTDEDDSYGWDPDGHGQFATFSGAADMSKIVMSEQRHKMLDFDRVTMMQANPAKVSKAL
eukprot:6303930-Pyramimonas_sp.AAC.2